ncbi:hypothetical protein GOP47_0028487 [Adiantum capillus-veneris]|nr:hypothetical protein GOP47_0028487 [Adiantum capillus-veneris]
MSMICRFGRRGSAIVVSVVSRELSSAAVSKTRKPEKEKQLETSIPALHKKQGKHNQPKSSTPATLARSKLHSPKKPETLKQQEQHKPADHESQDQPEQQEVEVAQIDDVFLPPGALSVAGLRRLACSNIFVGTTVKSANIEHAEFVKSSVCVKECPKGELPEFAFVGRSNVGKSSLINTLVRRRQLAKTSKTPGKTQLINHFSIDKTWYLVDLPGYGFARAPTDIRVSWDNFTRDYFLKRETLVCVLLLIDASVPPKKLDIKYTHWLASNKVPFTLVFTKCDKRKTRSKNAAQNNVFAFLECLKVDVEKVPPWVMTSCVSRQGTNELLLHLAHLRDYWEKQTNILLPSKNELS